MIMELISWLHYMFWVFYIAFLLNCVIFMPFITTIYYLEIFIRDATAGHASTCSSGQSIIISLPQKVCIWERIFVCLWLGGGGCSGPYLTLTLQSLSILLAWLVVQKNIWLFGNFFYPQLEKKNYKTL